LAALASAAFFASACHGTRTFIAGGCR
jgi:hypothetical protein